MAYYKYQQFITQSNGNANAFDTLHEPGQATPYSGIYRCEGCGHNAVSTGGHTLPPQNHHQHTVGQGAIRWRLIVSTN